MGIFKKYRALVTEIKKPLPDIFTIHFVSDKQFQYLPGQFLHLSLDEYDPSMPWPDSRCFSMQSSPNNDELSITFAVKGKFTLRMAEELRVGKKIWLKLPYGELFQKPHSKENCVFIAGGTGITPFLSLFTDSSFAQYANPKLYFGFRSEKYHIFKDELIRSKTINSLFVVTIIDQKKEGILNIESIYNECQNATFFISGPPIMIKNFKNSLLENNVVEKRIITDDWE